MPGGRTPGWSMTLGRSLEGNSSLYSTAVSGKLGSEYESTTIFGVVTFTIFSTSGFNLLNSSNGTGGTSFSGCVSCAGLPISAIGSVLTLSAPFSGLAVPDPLFAREARPVSGCEGGN